MDYYTTDQRLMFWLTKGEKMDNKKKILLVEDEAIIRRVHNIFLSEMGYKVETADSGKQTLELCNNNFYDLIILDGSLPDMKGVELGKKIRNLERKSQVKVRKSILLLSAYSAELLGEWCKEAEIDSFLVKPIRYDDLFFILEDYFAKGSFSRAA